MRTFTHPLFLLTFAAAACASDPATAPTTPSSGALDRSAAFPDVIALPTGFGADGIGFGVGTTLFVGSSSSGAIWRGDARTGAGTPLVAARTGRSACAVAYEAGRGRLFVAGSFSGQAYVYDATSGATLASYQLGDPQAGPTAILDVALLRDAAYFTDVLRPVLYRLPIASDGTLPSQSAVQEIPLSDDYQFVAGGALNSTGIVATPSERWLIVANATTGALYRVDPATGQAKAIDLAGGSIVTPDGIALVGHTLYVNEVFLNQVAVVRLDETFSTGVVAQMPANPMLDSPSKLAVFGNALYAVNARFEIVPAPGVTYEVVRMAR